MGYYSMVTSRCDTQNQAYQQLAANIVLQACNDYIDTTIAPEIHGYLKALAKQYIRTQKPDKKERIFLRAKEVCNALRSPAKLINAFGVDDATQDEREEAARAFIKKPAQGIPPRQTIESLEAFFRGRLYEICSGGGIDAEAVIAKLKEAAAELLEELEIGRKVE